MKWVAGFGANNALGLPAINAVVVLNDAATGLPTRDPRRRADHRDADGRRVRRGDRAGSPRGSPGGRHAPRSSGPGSRAGAISRCSGTCCPESRWRSSIDIPSVRPRWPRGGGDRRDRRRYRPRPTPRPPIRDADVVVTAASFGPVRQVMTEDWLADDALVVPVDYATYCAAEVARDAALFLVDERGQFLANRDAGAVRRLPRPDGDPRRGDPGRHATARGRAASS